MTVTVILVNSSTPLSSRFKAGSELRANRLYLRAIDILVSEIPRTNDLRTT